MSQTKQSKETLRLLYPMDSGSAGTIQCYALKNGMVKQQISSKGRLTMSIKLMQSVEERRKNLENRFPEWPRDTVARHFEKAARTYAEKPFLYINNEEYTYEDIWNRAVDYAKGLIKLGVKRRDHVAILMDNDASFPSLMVASSIVGAVFIPINSMLTKSELEYILSQSDTKYLILQEKVKDKRHGQAVKELL